MRLLLIYILLTSALATLGLTVVIWSFSILSPKRKSASLIYGIGTLVTALAAYLISEGDGKKRIIALILGLVIALPYLLDRRRAPSRINPLLDLVKNLIRGSVVLIYSTSLILFSLDIRPHTHFVSFIGMFFIFLSSYFLHVSTRQQELFEGNPLNRKRVCKEGFFAKCRHPGYFFKLTNAFGLLLLGLTSPQGALCLIPFFLQSLIILLFAIPRREKELVLRLGNEYQLYKQEVNRLIPK